MAHTALNALVRHIRRTVDRTEYSALTDPQLLGRFLATRDEGAFAALVRRHGGLVVAACRRVLTEAADVEDAFQATFLVLLRKAETIRSRQSLASWLYRVAARAAGQARAAADRRRRVERHSAVPEREPKADPSWREMCTLVHEELDRLPLRFRLPLILCYLDGKTRDEAAAQLGWSVGVLRGRLERGRQLLRTRLTRRGIEMSAALLAALAAETGRAVAPALLRATVGLAAGGAGSAAIAALANGVTAAAASKLTVAGLVVAVVLAATGAGIKARQPIEIGEPPIVSSPKPAPAGANKKAAAQAQDAIAYSGQVLRPDGKPVAGAKLYLTMWWGYHYEPFTSPESATTGPDGRFEFTAPKAKYLEQPAIVSAAAPNLGVGWVGIHKDEKRTDLTLKLVADDVPIVGQVVDLEGKPVRGATLRVLQIMASPAEDLGPWLEAANDKTAPASNRSTDLEQKHLSQFCTAPTLAVTTDAAGRFRLTGIGRERLVVVQLDGPTIASQRLHIRTRPGESFEVPWMEADPEYGSPRMATTYYGSSFRHVAGPTKPIVGIVRDKDTKKPLAGVTIQSDKLANNPVHGIKIVQTTTDAQGRYRLTGLPTGTGNKFKVVPPEDLPYISPRVDVPDSFGLDPVTVDIELKRALWIEGKITDKVTSKPVRGNLMYLVRDGNPNLRDYPGFYGGLPFIATKEDGTYRTIGLAGPGQIVVLRAEGYLLGAERDDEDGLKEGIGYMPHGNFGAFARIDPAIGVDSIKRDIAMVPGWTFTGTVVGPDGKPLAGAQHFGLYGEREQVMKGAEFTVRQFNPNRPRPVFFRLPEKGLVGAAQPPKDNGGSVIVRMEPGATLTGRLLDTDGQPRIGDEVTISYRPKAETHWDENYFPEHFKTDREGRFHIAALQRGYAYWLHYDRESLSFGRDLRPGETKDLGDVRTKRAGN